MEQLENSFINAPIMEHLKYDHETLKTLVIDRYYSAEQIAEVFGRDEKGWYKYPVEKIKEDLYNWGISCSYLTRFDIMLDIKNSMAEAQETINMYTRKNKASYRKFTDIARLQEKLMKYLNKDKVSDDAIEQLVEQLSNLSMKDMIGIHQADEKIRAEYFRILKSYQDSYLKCVEVQTKALQSDIILASVHEELVKIDETHKTNFHIDFIENVRRRAMEKISSEKFITKKDLKIKKGRPNGYMTAMQKNYTDVVKGIAEKYNIHFQVAMHAYKFFNEDTKKDKNPDMEECVERGIKHAFKIYPYIDEKGQKI